jgi:microcystin-dependent protein
MGGSAANRITSGSSGITGTTLGASGGEQVHTLSIAELAAHGHGVNDPWHGHGVNDPTHAHNIYNTNFGLGGQGGGNVEQYAGGPADSTTYNATGISIAANPTGISIQGAGSSAAHQNMPPTLILNYIIKT